MNPQGDSAYANRHLEESYKLDAEGYAHLYSIRMYPPNESDILMTINPQRDVTWQGYTWDSWPVNLSDYKRESSGEASRPKFSLGNLNGLFSRYVHEGWMDTAEVCRYRVLGPHLEGNINSFLKNTWRVGKVVSLSKSLVVVELREILDWQLFIMPGRAYYPPEYPTVSV